jgi:WD40 repeat protein
MNDPQPTASVFISYSRRDIAFADRLEAGLKARQFTPLIDRTEIYAFEDWWNRIQALIAKAHTIVFVLSPASVSSDICRKEVAFAASLNKRFAPIVCRPVDPATVPEQLSRLNFVLFDDDARFEESLDRLVEALSTDIEWVRKHTELGEQARRWSEAGRPGPQGLLLRSPVLEDAERWIASRPSDAPQPTVATQDFIVESRRAATRRRNALSATLGAGLVAALVLAGIAYWQRGVAVEERNVAEKRRIETLAELADSETLRDNLDTSLRLGVHAARLALAPELGGVEIPGPRAALAAAVVQSQLRLILQGHQERVNSAAFSPDGTRIVTASFDKTARVWDAGTGAEISVLRGHQDHVNFAAFSPDGRRIVTTSDDRTARIWDAASGSRIVVVSALDFGAMSFSPDSSRIVTTSDDQAARVWDAATGREISVMHGHTDTVHSAAFSPDGKRVVTASGFDSSDNDNDNTARIWDTATGREIAVLRGHGGAVHSAAFSPDGTRIVTASYDKTVRIWDATTANQIAVLRGHAEEVDSAVFSPDGKRIVSVSIGGFMLHGDSTAHVWDTMTGEETAVLRGVHSAAFSPNSLYIVTAGSVDQTARIWDAVSGKEMAVLRGHEGDMLSAAFSPDGKSIVTASYDKTARIWDIKTDKEIAVLRGQESESFSVAFTPDGSRIVTRAGQAVRIWDAATGAEISVLRGQQAGDSYQLFSPDGSRIATMLEDKAAHIRDAVTGKETVVLREHQVDLYPVAFSPDGTRIVTASSDKTARVWDITTGLEIAVFRGHESGVTSASFSSDGKYVVTGSGQPAIFGGLAQGENTARVWEAATGKEIEVLRGHSLGVAYAAFSPDGKRIVTASYDKTARIWDASTGEEIEVLRGHQDSVNSAAFSPDGKSIVTTSYDRTARIWDAATGKGIAVLRGHEGWVFSAAFSPNADRIVTASSDKTARIWDVHLATMSTSDLLREVCTRVLRGRTRLTREEMHVSGYSDHTPEIDVCSGIE